MVNEWRSRGTAYTNSKEWCSTRSGRCDWISGNMAVKSSFTPAHGPPASKLQQRSKVRAPDWAALCRRFLSQDWRAAPAEASTTITCGNKAELLDTSELSVVVISCPFAAHQAAEPKHKSHDDWYEKSSGQHDAINEVVRIGGVARLEHTMLASYVGYGYRNSDGEQHHEGHDSATDPQHGIQADRAPFSRRNGRLVHESERWHHPPRQVADKVFRIL